MKHSIFCLIVIIIAISSCGPEPTTHNRKVTRVTGIDPYRQGTDPTNEIIAPGATVYCTVAGSNCYEYVGQGDIVVFRTVYNNFISASENNDLAGFFQTNQWRTIFPSDSPVTDSDVNKVISGDYPVKIMEDSSIVIFNNKLMLDADNVLFAIKRVQ